MFIEVLLITAITVCAYYTKTNLYMQHDATSYMNETLKIRY